MTARGLTYAELATGFAKTYTTTQIEIVLSESGKSAYELAVENGFVGTTIEWLASLVGTSGADRLIYTFIFKMSTLPTNYHRTAAGVPSTYRLI
jgi:hypothetical protein